MSLMREAIRVPLSSSKIQNLYNFLSHIYDLITRYEARSKSEALKLVTLKDSSKILEVGFGTGKILYELLIKVGDEGEIYGLDISKNMAHKAFNMIKHHGLTERANIIIGQAESPPFIDSFFDTIFCSYMLDLIDTPQLPEVISEFRRILKPKGQVVLTSLSKGVKWSDNMKLYEWIYNLSPSLLGGCRPVFLKPYLHELGFKNVNRKFMHAGGVMPIEILWANKN